MTFTQSAAKHPRGLFVLTAMEIWERFSYFGMLTLLMLYMKEYLHLQDDESSNLVGTYTGLVYLATLPGGVIADRVLGHMKAVYLGGLLMILGHLAMAFGTIYAMYLAFALIASGNGLFKPSMSSQVRGLYPAGDSRIDSAFSIYYFGVNVGAFLAPPVVAFIRARWGWHAAFGAAGVGLTIGLVQLFLQRRHLFDRSRNLTVAFVEETQQLSPRATRRRGRSSRS